MLIPCPVCGLRDAGEFTNGGDASIVRPAFDDGDEAAWAAAIYDRANPRGGHKEYWHHVDGCRHWLIVARDTQTHADFSARLAGPWAEHQSDKAGDMPGDKVGAD